VGDIRVTVSYPGERPDEEHEGVQKLYKVGANIAAGFAGNVDVGFRMISGMSASLNSSIPADAIITEPSRFLAKWARRARHHWEHTVPVTERQGGCSLLVMAALQPTGPFTRTVAYRLHAPDFNLDEIPPRTARSIGSGADVSEYQATLERLGHDFFELVQFETMYWPFGPAPMIASELSDVIEVVGTPGISPHLHICTVRFGEVEILTNDRQALTPGVESRVMPPVVAGWEQWKAWKLERGLADLVAIAA